MVTGRPVRIVLAGAVLYAVCGAGSAALAQVTPPTALAQPTSRPPIIDGRLDDTAWQAAPAASDFRQKEPNEGQPASEATTVWILYDRSRLYIGVHLRDSQPDQIRASELRRDNSLGSDDSFSVLLDTFHDHRNAFLFRVNAHGTRFDAIVRNESQRLDADWDEDWVAAATTTNEGWSVEIAIPLKILRFSPAQEQVWGLNFERLIRRKNESDYWANWDRNYAFTHVSQAGHLVGLKDIRQAERLRIRPYLVAGSEKLDAVSSPVGARLLRDVGLDDVKLTVTPNLTADATVNPDFAQTEVDAQRVNLTRFSLFFPEKRQFFIEGADSLRMRIASNPFAPPSAELFHSRRIGLSASGLPIRILGGGKLTGKLRGFDIGVLNVQTAESGGRSGENLGVARVRKELLGRSYVGALMTSRQGGGEFNRLLGADAHFILRRYLTVTGMAARTFTKAGDQAQWLTHLAGRWETDRIEASASYLNVDPKFDPGLGFVQRRDRMMNAEVAVKPRPGGTFVRQFELGPSITYHHDARGQLLTRELGLGIETAFQSGDQLEVSVSNDIERLLEPFEIGAGIRLSVGQYEWNQFRLEFRSFRGRNVSGSATMEVGDFYTGTKRSLEMSGDIRRGAHVSVGPSYEVNDVNLREGSFQTHLLGLKANVSFSTNLLTSAYLQYNSSGDLAAVQLRLNYIFRTIDNFYVVYNETRWTGGRFADRANRSVVMKVTYSVHR